MSARYILDIANNVIDDSELVHYFFLPSFPL